MPDGTYNQPLVSLRLPPTNIAAEQALLGAILSNNKAYDRVSEFLLPEHFADPAHASIYERVVARISKGQLADVLTLKDAYLEDGILDEVGGIAYLTELLSAMVAIINAGDYGQAIYDCWLRRQLIEHGTDVVNDAYHSDTDMDGPKQLDAAAQRLAELAATGVTKSCSISIKDAGAMALEEGRLAAEGKSIASVSTGLPSLDSAILRLRPGHLIIIGGRPGMGKSALVKSISINVSTGMGMTEDGEIIDDQALGRPVGFFSLEEEGLDFGASSIAQISGISTEAILNGEWTRNLQQADAIVKAQKRYESAPLEIFDRPRQSLRDITREARALKRRRKDLGLVVVDYLQLMPDPAGFKDKRLAVGQNAYGLKDLAKELGCAVILLSQLGRQVESRTDRRPVMSDLRETGEIEDAADVVMFPYREEYYFAQTRPKDDGSQPRASYVQQLQEWQTQLDTLRGKAELIVPKVRRGPAPVYRDLFFNGRRTRFEEVMR